MSMTSGPVLPASTGNSSDFPSGSFRLAVLSAMVFLSGGAQARHDISQVRLVVLTAPGDDVPQVVVGEVKQFGQVRISVCGLQIAAQNDIELEQSPAALPLEL